jgi:hypothetical protein
MNWTPIGVEGRKICERTFARFLDILVTSTHDCNRLGDDLTGINLVL